MDAGREVELGFEFAIVATGSSNGVRRACGAQPPPVDAIWTVTLWAGEQKFRWRADSKSINPENNSKQTSELVRTVRKVAN